MHCAYVLTFSPGSPLDDVKGSYCAGLCLNLCTSEGKVKEKEKNTHSIREARMKGRRAQCTVEIMGHIAKKRRSCREEEVLNENLPDLPDQRSLPEG